MRPIKFCGSCGSSIEEPGVEEGSRCPSCGRDWYRNPAPTAGGVIVRDGRALVSVRGSEPKKGKVDVPGGFLHLDEDPIEGLKRELREELGIEIEAEVGDCLSMAPHVYGDEGERVLALGFKVRLVSGDPQPSDDVADIMWVSKAELDQVDFAWEHDRELVRRALAAQEEG